MSGKKDVFINYYKLLGVEQNATLQEIRRAYRQKALELHPDKNPDNPKADELFQAVKTAAEILSDETTRAEIDKELAARAAAAERHAAMDSRRAALKEVLEARERASAAAAATSVLHPKKYAEDIEKLRKEGMARQREYADQLESRRLAAVRLAAARMGQSAEEEEDTSTGAFDLECAIRLRWTGEINARMGQQSGSAYGVEGRVLSDAQLERIFSLYGKVELVFSRKAKSASILFNSSAAAEAAKSVPPDGFRISLYSDFTEPTAAPTPTPATAPTPSRPDKTPSAPSATAMGVSGTKRSAFETAEEAEQNAAPMADALGGSKGFRSQQAPKGQDGRTAPSDISRGAMLEDPKGSYVESLWTSLSHEDHALEVARKATAVAKLRKEVLEKAKAMAI